MTAATSNTRLANYANALHECVDKIEKLQWDNPEKPEDKKQIVKHLRAFIERTSPSGKKQSIEQAIHEIQQAIASEVKKPDFRTLSQIKSDITILDNHFSNGDVFEEVANNRSIFSYISISRLFGHRPKPRISTEEALTNYHTKLSQLNTTIDTADFSYYAEQCKPLISFIARYSPETADDYRQRLQRNPVALHQEILKDLATSIDGMLPLLKKRLDNPQKIELYNSTIDDIRFLKECIETHALAGKKDLAQAVVRALGEERGQRRAGDYNAEALSILTKLEKTVQTHTKDKNREALAILQKIDQLKEETLQFVSFVPLSPKAEEIIAKAKSSQEPGKHLKELQHAHQGIKEEYVSYLKNNIKKMEGLEPWVTALLEKPEFEKDVKKFADEFSQETNPTKKMLMWDLFVADLKDTHAPEKNKSSLDLIRAVLMTSPSDKFLHALLDIDQSVLTPGSKLEAKPQLESLNRIYQALNSVLASTALKTEGKKYTKEALQASKERVNLDEQCRNLISLLMRYHPDAATAFQQKLLNPKVNLEQLHKEILDNIIHNIEPIIKSLEERLKQPDRIGYYDNIAHEIQFLKHLIKTNALAGGPDFSYLVWQNLGEQGDLKENERGFKTAALRTLDKIEHKILEDAKDKNRMALQLIAKIDQLQGESAHDARFPLSEDLHELISKAKASRSPGEYLTKLQEEYKNMKETYVTEIGHALHEFRLQDVEAGNKGIAVMSPWQRRLLADRDFKGRVVEFAERFSAESDQYKKIQLWDSFVKEAKAKYAGGNKQNMIQTILLAYPSEKFLHALVDLDYNVLVVQTSPEASTDNRNVAIVKEIYTGLNSVLNPTPASKLEEMKATVKGSYGLLRHLKEEKVLRDELLEFNKDVNEPFRIPDMEQFVEDVRIHERRVLNAFDATFERLRKAKFQALERSLSLLPIESADVKFFDRFIKEKNDVKKLADFNTHMARLQNKYQLKDAQVPAFLQQLLMMGDKRVARAIQMIDKEDIQERRSGESVTDLKARKKAYKNLSEGLKAVFA